MFILLQTNLVTVCIFHFFVCFVFLLKILEIVLIIVISLFILNPKFCDIVCYFYFVLLKFLWGQYIQVSTTYY